MAEKEEAVAAAESALDVDRTAADGRGRTPRTTPWLWLAGTEWNF